MGCRAVDRTLSGPESKLHKEAGHALILLSKGQVLVYGQCWMPDARYGMPDPAYGGVRLDT